MARAFSLLLGFGREQEADRVGFPFHESRSMAVAHGKEWTAVAQVDRLMRFAQGVTIHPPGRPGLCRSSATLRVCCCAGQSQSGHGGFPEEAAPRDPHDAHLQQRRGAQSLLRTIVSSAPRFPRKAIRSDCPALRTFCLPGRPPETCRPSSADVRRFRDARTTRQDLRGFGQFPAGRESPAALQSSSSPHPGGAHGMSAARSNSNL